MNNKPFDEYETQATCDNLDVKGIESELKRESCEESVCARQLRLTAGPNLPIIHSSSTRVPCFQGTTETVFELLSQFLVNKWPIEVHLVESSRLSATIFVDFVPVKVEARVVANPGGCGTELAFVNNSISPDTVRFGNVVHACEKHLRTQLGELCKESQLKNELLEEENFDFELEDGDAEKGRPDFQDLLAEVVHCPSSKVREELLQSLAHLARDSMARSSLAEVFGSPIGMFAVCSYLRPHAETPASLAEIYPFAYLLRQAASCEDVAWKMAYLKGIIPDTTHSGLVARELELLLSYLPDLPDAQEGADADAEATLHRSTAL